MKRGKANLPPIGECREDACHAPIRFVSTDRGWVPVQPVPNPRRAGAIAARVVAGRLVGHWIGPHAPAAQSDLVFVPHGEACPGRRAAPSPEPSLFDTTTEENQ